MLYIETWKKVNILSRKRIQKPLCILKFQQHKNICQYYKLQRARILKNEQQTFFSEIIFTTHCIWKRIMHNNFIDHVIPSRILVEIEQRGKTVTFIFAFSRTMTKIALMLYACFWDQARSNRSKSFLRKRSVKGQFLAKIRFWFFFIRK